LADKEAEPQRQTLGGLSGQLAALADQGSNLCWCWLSGHDADPKFRNDGKQQLRDSENGFIDRTWPSVVDPGKNMERISRSDRREERKSQPGWTLQKRKDSWCFQRQRVHAARYFQRPKEGVNSAEF
jgi:hypothetical protein